MTLPSNINFGELWMIDRDTTFNTSFTAASSFVGSATKLKFFGLDLSGLKYIQAKDEAMQTAFEGQPAPIPIATSEPDNPSTFKFRMHLAGGSNDTDPTTITSMLGQVFGGLYSPTAISDSAEASCTSTLINATSHGMEENQAVLVGTRGDSGGDGRLMPIADASNANDYTLAMALPAAPAESAVLKNGHTIYLDWENENYTDFLFLGSHIGGGAADDPDQIQMLGCSGKASFGGFKEGETPFVEFEWKVGQWQWVNYADQVSALAHATAASGGNPVKGGGQLLIQDNGTTTRNTIKGGDVEIEYPFDIVAVRDYNNTNAIGGWVKVRPEMGPMMKCKAYWANVADMPGLYNDFINGTAKQVLFQVGNVTQKTVGFYMQKAYLQNIDPSRRVELEKMTNLELEFRGTTGGATDLSTAAKKLQDAAMVIFFH